MDVDKGTVLEASGECDGAAIVAPIRTTQKVIIAVRELAFDGIDDHVVDAVCVVAVRDLNLVKYRDTPNLILVPIQQSDVCI